MVPVIDLTNSSRLMDTAGTPEAVRSGAWSTPSASCFSDVMVASESTALPRRWATGLAVVEDEAGVPVNPFSASAGIGLAKRGPIHEVRGLQ